jgi:hypothetical protein
MEAEIKMQSLLVQLRDAELSAAKDEVLKE